MNINDFISNYRNHPVLFVGTGISLRYLKILTLGTACLERLHSILREMMSITWT